MPQYETTRSAKTVDSLPRINSKKIYRTPPTPPLEKLYELERSFKLDGIAVSNISLDYSKANPKLGSVIPPYNSLEDKSISTYLSNFGVPDLLKKTGQWDNPESIAGKVHDKFYKEGAGNRYLERRNVFGNGYHPETVDGHSRYQGEQLRVMIGYNNMYGYRRNIPKLRTEPPSTFSYDPRWYERIKNTYGEHFTEEELMEHFKNTYVIGYPFWDNNYNNFHPTVKYIITVKTGEKSPEEYLGNLGINIVARNFDTGFIKLDENIVCLTAKEKRDGVEKKDFFKRGQTDVFQFEDQDIRTISAIILSRDIKGDEVLYLDYVDVEIQKSNEKQSYRFPFDGWVRKAKQDKKTEELKQRFGKKNSLISYPNEKPKFEYTIIVAPQMSKNTEYSVSINYDIRDYNEEFDYRIEFSDELPKSGKIVLRLTGINGESNSFEFDQKTEPADPEDHLTFDVTNVDIGEIKYASVLYDDKAEEFDLKNIKVVDPDGLNYIFELDQPLRAKKEKIIKGKITSQSPMESSNDPPSEDGKLFVKLIGQTEETNLFMLKNASESVDGVHKFVKTEGFVGIIQNIRLRYEGKKYNYCKIKSIKITSDKGHEFNYSKNIILRNNEETLLSDRSKNRKAAPSEPKKSAQIMVQILGERLKTELFPLKEAYSNKDDLDEYYKIFNDLGRIKNVYVKLDGKPENDEKTYLKYIEIIDPRGNSYKYVMDINLEPGQDIMLPRKSKEKKQEPPSEETEETEETFETEETEAPTETEEEKKPIAKKNTPELKESNTPIVTEESKKQEAEQDEE